MEKDWIILAVMMMVIGVFLLYAGEFSKVSNQFTLMAFVINTGYWVSKLDTSITVVLW
jgi:hypothetical protein